MLCYGILVELESFCCRICLSEGLYPFLYIKVEGFNNLDVKNLLLGIHLSTITFIDRLQVRTHSLILKMSKTP